MKITFIGAGNMATAIIKSILNSGKISPDSICVFDKFSDKAEVFSSLGVNVSKTLEDACNFGDTVLLAVKPQDYESLLCDVKNLTRDLSEKLIISIAAAISCGYICKMLECDCPVIRIMPNTPVLLGMGAIAISRNEFVNDKVYSKVCSLFASCGVVCCLDEELMNKVICVNGSSPVFVYMMAKAMIDKGIEYGISEKNATELALHTIKGSVEMLIKSGKTPDELISQVASPGGTTLAAISSMQDDGFYELMNKAMDACTKRADELSK